MKYKQAVGYHLLHTIIHNIVREKIKYYYKISPDKVEYTNEDDWYKISKDISIKNLYDLWTTQNIYMIEIGGNDEGIN